MAHRINRWQALVMSAALFAPMISVLRADEPAAAADSGPTLNVGSKAPALDIAHWVQDGKGKFKPVTKFAPGKIYVVEFWATWCGPCVASMPHLAEMQNEYAGKGVQFVSVSDEDLETVEKFLDGEVPSPEGDDNPKADADKDKKAQTFRDLTSAWCLTTDPDHSTSKDYMEAAQQNGIPTAFLVGKDGIVEWIGHPMELEEPLKAVIDGSWDRVAYLQKMEERQAAERALREVFAHIQRQDYTGALELLDKQLVDSEDVRLKMLKLQLLLAANQADDANTWAKSLFKECSDKPDAVNMIAWSIFQMAEAGVVKKGPLVDTAIKATSAAVDTAPKQIKASVLDTLARLHFINDDFDKSIALQKQAIKIATPAEAAALEEFLNKATEAKEKQGQADSSSK